MKKITTMVVAVVLLFTLIVPGTRVYAEDEEVFSFELPIEGATGFASIKMDLLENPSKGAAVVRALMPGDAFTIKGETEEYFFVDVIGEGYEEIGWVKKSLVMINLPDIIPSIIYYDSNSDASMFKSSGIDLPKITGEQLYNCYLYNGRFQSYQYVMPVLYGMACKIMVAQQSALAEGNSLKIYETYRPHTVQMDVSNTLSNLMNSNSKVYSGIAPWGKGWFIATSYSNHQRGRAMDVSLVSVNSMQEKIAGECCYYAVESYEEYVMPTAMHELSVAAVTFKYGVGKDAWKSAPLSKGMQESTGAQLLQKYCTQAGMTPLASEWWHFDDNTCSGKCNGDFLITTCLSETP